MISFVLGNLAINTIVLWATTIYSFVERYKNWKKKKLKRMRV